MIPSPHFLQALSQMRLQPRHAQASIGHGERRSKARGAGMEFADYREYSPGDDTRHLDARLHARLGGFHVRQYEVMRQLPVTIIIDASRSMASVPAKLATARLLANCLGYAALVGNDRVKVGVWTGKRLEQSDAFSGVSRARRLFDWVERREASGYAPLDEGAAGMAEAISPNGLGILISDFWLEDPRRLLLSAASRGAEIWALQVLSREEITPGASGGGAQLVDAETGNSIELSLDASTLAHYGAAFTRWQAGLTEAAHGLAGRHHLLVTDDDLDQLISTLRGWGLVG